MQCPKGYFYDARTKTCAPVKQQRRQIHPSDFPDYQAMNAPYPTARKKKSFFGRRGQKGGATGKCTFCPTCPTCPDCPAFTLLTDKQTKKLRDILTMVVGQGDKKKRRFNQNFEFDLNKQMKNQSVTLPEYTNMATLSKKLADRGVRCDNCVFSDIPGPTTLLDHLTKTNVERVVNGVNMTIPLGAHKYVPNYDEARFFYNDICARESCGHDFSAHAPKQTGGRPRSPKGTKLRKVVRHRSTKRRAARRSVPKGSITVSARKLVKSNRFTLACRGHSRIRGGLNTVDIVRIAKRMKVSTSGKRVDILRRICKRAGKRTTWASMSAPKGKARHLLKYHCGSKCFLMPKEEKFPVCPDYSVSRKCKPICSGLLAAKRRASEWHYAGVRAKAVTMMKRMKCKSTKRRSTSPKHGSTKRSKSPKRKAPKRNKSNLMTRARTMKHRTRKHRTRKYRTGGGLFGATCPSSLSRKDKAPVVSALSERTYADALFAAGVKFEASGLAKQVIDQLMTTYSTGKHTGDMYFEIEELLGNSMYDDSFVPGAFNYGDYKQQGQRVTERYAPLQPYVEYAVCKINTKFNRSNTLNNEYKITLEDPEMKELLKNKLKVVLQTDEVLNSMLKDG